MHEKLTEGDALAVSRVPAARAAILDAAGQPIVQKRPVVRGRRGAAGGHRHQRRWSRTLDEAFQRIGVDRRPDRPARAGGRRPSRRRSSRSSRCASPTTRRSASEIQPLDGTVFREEQWDLAPTRAFARALLGTVDPVQKADMDAKPGVYEVGDQVGHGGLQGAVRGPPARHRRPAGADRRPKAPDGTPSRQTEIYRASPSRARR